MEAFGIKYEIIKDDIKLEKLINNPTKLYNRKF